MTTNNTKFDELLDVFPHSYSGEAGKVYVVNPDETGLIPVTVESIITVNPITENHIPVGGTGAIGDVLKDTNIQIVGVDIDEIEGVGKISASANKDLNLVSADGNVLIQDAWVLPNVAGPSEVGKVLTCTSSGFSDWVTPTGGGSFPGLYVAKTGNDTTGDGSIGNPFLTFTKAVSVSSSGTTIYGMDAGLYDENITLPGFRVNIDAPYASLIPSTGTHAIQFNFNTQYIINFKLIQGVGGLGGLAIESTTFGNIFLTLKELYGGILAGNAYIHLTSCNAGGAWDKQGLGGQIFGFVTDISAGITVVTPGILVLASSGVPVT